MTLSSQTNPGRPPELSPGPSSLAVTEKVRLMRDGLVNFSGFLFSGFVGLLLVPLMLRRLDAELYGLWIAQVTVNGITAIFDFGLNSSVTREVAAASSRQPSEETTRFLNSAGRAYLVLGILGGIFITALGFLFSASLHLADATRRIVPVVFALGGMVFFCEQLSTFANTVFHGKRCFDTANWVSIVTVLLRAAGILLVLTAGAGLVAVAASQVVASALATVVALLVLQRLQPGLRLRPGRLDWTRLRGHIRFGVGSQLTMLANKVIWDAPPLLLGAILGPAWIVPYYIGQKFPRAVYELVWRAAVVLFPAASEQERRADSIGTRQTLEVGTRWITVMTLPMCLLSFILAPGLLAAWVGEARPDVVSLMRLMTAAVFVHAVGASALEVLWGRGAVRTVLAVLTGVAIASLAISSSLLTRVGIVGIGWGLLLVNGFGSLAFLYLVSPASGTRPWDLMRATFKGLLLPAFAAAMAAFGVIYCIQSSEWLGILGAVVAGAIAYLACFCVYGANEHERILARQVSTLPATLSRAGYRFLRRPPPA